MSEAAIRDLYKSISVASIVHSIRDFSKYKGTFYIYKKLIF